MFVLICVKSVLRYLLYIFHLSASYILTLKHCQVVWSDLAKFRHVGKTSKVFGYYLRVYFVLGKILNLIGHIFGILGKFSLLLLEQYWRDNLAIWSHCCQVQFLLDSPSRQVVRHGLPGPEFILSRWALIRPRKDNKDEANREEDVELGKMKRMYSNNNIKFSSQRCGKKFSRYDTIRWLLAEKFSLFRNCFWKLKWTCQKDNLVRERLRKRWR